MEPFAVRAVRAAYDAVAEDYVTAFADDLERLPVDRAVLDAGIARLDRRGPVLDVGCGPGQVGDYLAARGVEVIGLDLAPAMLEAAKRRTGAAKRRVVCADMRRLPVRSRSCGGAVAFYSIHHLPRAAVGDALGEFNRVLAPGGVLVLATHLGKGETYSEEFLGHSIERVGGTLYSDEEIERALIHNSFVVEDVQHRDPLPHEYPSHRVYVTARREEG